MIKFESKANDFSKASIFEKTFCFETKKVFESYGKLQNFKQGVDW